MLSQMILLNSTAKGTGMTALEELMEAHEMANEYSKNSGCTYEIAFREVWECVWYDENGEVKSRPSNKKTQTLLT